MSSEFDDIIAKKAAINKNKARDLYEAKNQLMAVGTLFAHTSLDYVANIQIAHSRKCQVVLESVGARRDYLNPYSPLFFQLSTFISDYSNFFQKGHNFFKNKAEIDMDKINEAITSMKAKSKIVERKMQER